MEIEREVYNVREACQILGLSRQLVYSRCKDGTLPVLKIGKRYLLPKIALDKLLMDPPKPTQLPE